MEKREKKENRKNTKEKENETLKPKSKSLSVRDMIERKTMIKVKFDFR